MFDKMKKPMTSVKKGALLMTAKPFVYVLLSKLQGKSCDYCLKSTRVLKCTRCRFVHYCDRTCQTKAWVEHKEECVGMRRISPRTLPDAARMLAKLIIKLTKGGDLEKAQITETWSRRFRDLMSHYSDIKQDAKRLEHYESLRHILAEFFGGDNALPNSAEMLGIYGRLCVNGFNILDGEMNCIGVAIYLAPSIIDHSCKPNAVVTFVGTTLYMRALADMPKFDWKKVHISYVDLLSLRSERRQELKKAYYFWCECERCQTDSIEVQNGCQWYDDEAFSSAVACPHFGCGSPIIMERKAEGSDMVRDCKICGYTLSKAEISNYKETYEFSSEKIHSMGSTAYLDVCQVLLRRQESALFHPLNLLYVKTLDLAVESAIQMNCWDDALALGRQMLPGFRQYHGAGHPLVGILCLKIAKVALLIGRPPSEARALVREAMKILSITHGVDHPLLKSELEPLIHEVGVATS